MSESTKTFLKDVLPSGVSNKQHHRSLVRGQCGHHSTEGPCTDPLSVIKCSRTLWLGIVENAGWKATIICLVYTQRRNERSPQLCCRDDIVPFSLGALAASLQRHLTYSTCFSESRISVTFIQDSSIHTSQILWRHVFFFIQRCSPVFLFSSRQQSERRLTGTADFGHFLHWARGSCCSHSLNLNR